MLRFLRLFIGYLFVTAGGIATFLGFLFMGGMAVILTAGVSPLPGESISPFGFLDRLLMLIGIAMPMIVSAAVCGAGYFALPEDHRAELRGNNLPAIH